jgi:membrane-associated protease RseP (regulator of RpoE activity)
MSGPKHLWSGDWQRESDAASDELAGRRLQPGEPEPAVPAPDPARPRPRAPVIPKRLRSPRALGITLVAVLFLAAGAFGLTALLGSSGPQATTSAAAPSFQPAPAATTATIPATPSIAPSPYVSWLGMQIQTLPPGAAVIETVRLGSPGDLAGLEPGDVILAINHRSINGASDIGPAIHGLHAGDHVELQISHGSGLTKTDVTLAAPPSPHP